MSKHDLKGIDTSKVGKNKDVAYTFEDYKRQFGLSDKGAIRDLESRNVFLSDLNPVITTQEKTDNFLRDFAPAITGAGLAPVLVNKLGGDKPVDAADLEVVGGRLVGKDRPKGLRGGIASLLDAATFGATDLDKMGGGPLQGLLTGSQQSMQGYGKKFTGDYKLPKALTDRLEQEQETASKDPLSTENLDKLLDYELKYKRATDAMDRKGRALDAAMEMANIRANMPFITQQMKDLSTFKQAQLLEAERAKQGMPNAIQSRLLAADTGFATQAGAIAGQQDAATRFAGLGMQRRFG
tara:strand:- start:649 stop:1536 length:888 start_codon:yes stop_codon:yes gene_type:complete